MRRICGLPIGISIFARDDSEIKAPLNSTIQIAKGFWKIILSTIKKLLEWLFLSSIFYYFIINDAYFIFGIESVSKKLRLYKYFRGENTVDEILIQNINDNNQEVGMNTAKVMMYVYKNKIAFTYRAGKVLNPYLLYMYDFDNTNLLKFNSEIELASSFSGTSNYIMNDEGVIISETNARRLRMYTFNKQEINVYILKENVVNIFTKNTNDRFIQVGETAILWK